MPTEVNIFENHFKFPIMLSERNKLPQLDMTGEMDYIVAYALIPALEFPIPSVSDRWLPTAESRTNAEKGEFDACLVSFSPLVEYLVPMPKEEFMRRLSKWYNKNTSISPTTQVVVLDKDAIKEYLNKGEKKDENEG